MKRILRYGAIVLVVLFVAIQFVPVERSNPPVTGLVDAPEDVLNTLQRSCWDCHSNETDWPWYAYVAPMSLRVSQHVRMGRQHVNFTEWDGYDAEDLDEAYEDIAEEMEKAGMPLSDYLARAPGREADSGRPGSDRLVGGFGPEADRRSRILTGATGTGPGSGTETSTP